LPDRYEKYCCSFESEILSEDATRKGLPNKLIVSAYGHGDYSTPPPPPPGRLHTTCHELALLATGVSNACCACGSAAISDGPFRLINDPCIDPFARKPQQSALKKPNCAFMEVQYRGWPYIFILSVDKICKGEELCLEYGEEYWDGMRSSTSQAESARRSRLTQIESYERLALQLGASERHRDMLRDLRSRCIPERANFACTGPTSAQGALC
jgi:hypothetical protein